MKRKPDPLLFTYNEQHSFMRLNTMPGCCSTLVLSIIIKKYLAHLSKDQIITLIHYKNEKKIKDEKLNLDQIKVIQIHLNTNRFWSLFTPWKYGYSYKGNHGKVSVFYLKVE